MLTIWTPFRDNVAPTLFSCGDVNRHHKILGMRRVAPAISAAQAVVLWQLGTLAKSVRLGSGRLSQPFSSLSS